MTLNLLSATDLLARMTGDVTSTAVTQACLERIAQLDEQIGAFLQVDSEAALRTAEDVDRRRRQGQRLGPLAGLPIAVKDLICTRSATTTCASRMLQDFQPPYDATVIERLRAADAVLIGKTNMDEFAMGSSTENSALQVTCNPWNLECVPGGSSGGSAACLAAGMVPLSLGSDTGGSIRQPASYCGVTGLKPTYGRVSRYGLVAFASSLDQIGPLGRSAADAALLLQVIAGHDPRDSTSVSAAVPDYSSALAASVKGLRLGRIREHFEEGLNASVRAAVDEALRVLQDLGARIVDVPMPHSSYGIATYYLVASCEASSNLARYDGVHYGYRTPQHEMLAQWESERRTLEAAGQTAELEQLDSPLVRMYRQTRAEGFGPEVKRRIMLGTYALSAGYYDAYYLKASKVRRLIRADYDAAFQQVDLLVGPTAPTTAFRQGAKTDDPLAMYLEDLFTVTANLAGVPAISIPCGFDQGLPLGLQLQAPALGESRLLQTAFQFQQATDWHAQMPPLS